MNFVKDIGTNLYLGGFILVGREEPIVVLFPESELWPGEVVQSGWLSIGNLESGDPPQRAFKPTLEQFQDIIRQMDIMETEIALEDGSKIIYRKSQRSLDNRITWKVFKRDEYKCRYCGADNVPLTYDHVHLWEDGGENSEENGVTSCNKCNKQRGNMDYAKWLNSKIYQEKSKNVENKFKAMNLALLPVYQGFKKRISVKDR